MNLWELVKNLWSAVGGSVVDNQHVGDMLQDPAEHFRDMSLLVEDR
jgi:hypothetical protein